jgi:hypothetical protein
MAGEARRDHADDTVSLRISELRFLSAPIGGEKRIPIRPRRRGEGRQRLAPVAHIEHDVRLGDLEDAVERGFRRSTGRRDVPLQ